MMPVATGMLGQTNANVSFTPTPVMEKAVKVNETHPIFHIV